MPAMAETGIACAFIPLLEAVPVLRGAGATAAEGVAGVEALTPAVLAPAALCSGSERDVEFVDCANVIEVEAKTTAQKINCKQSFGELLH